jgi:hypothetical protein
MVLVFSEAAADDSSHRSASECSGSQRNSQLTMTRMPHCHLACGCRGAGTLKGSLPGGERTTARMSTERKS